MKISKTLFVVLFTLCLSSARGEGIPPKAQAFSLGDLIEMAMQHNRSLQSAGHQVDAARAGIESARAYPNPEVESVRGSLRGRQQGGADGTSQALWVTQRIEYPWLRDARINAASAGYDAVRAEYAQSQNELVARLRYRFYELLRQEAELLAAQEDEATIQQIAHRIKLKVETGESPRFESIKAETELLSARKTVQSAELKLNQTRATLRQLVGAALPPVFNVSGQLREVTPVPPLERLLEEIRTRNPELIRSRALTRQAERLHEYERHQRWPTISIKGGQDQTPDVRDQRVGIVLTIPLWDRRSGPVAEAAAKLSKARNEESLLEFNLEQNLVAAWQQWRIAAFQVQALQTGIVAQAENALRIAEAAYRHGERGILEYLDAQRVYRAARNDLISARFDQHVAAIEIDRMRSAFVSPSGIAQEFEP